MSLFKFNKHKVGDIQTGLFPCLSGDDVINNSAKNSVQHIRNLISAPSDVYNKLYLTTLYRFAEFCQSMPWDEDDDPCSLLTEQLRICTAALKLRQGLLLPENSDAEIIAMQEPQWTYAIFSTSLIFLLGRIQEDRQIILYSASGECIGQWHPIIGNLYEHDAYFSIEWHPSVILSSEALQSAIVTRIVSPSVIRWLAQNSTLFLCWWNAITKGFKEEHNPIIAVMDEALEFNCRNVEKDKVEESQNLINHLLDYLSQKQNVENSYFLRIESGLLVCNNLLDEFVTTQRGLQDKSKFIEIIQSALIKKDNQFYFRYRPKAFEDRHFLEGIIIKEEFLDESWKQRPINQQFQLDITI
jgi:hypothetical protein